MSGAPTASCFPPLLPSFMSRDEHMDDIPAGADARVTQSRREQGRVRRQKRNRRQIVGVLLCLALLVALIRAMAPGAPILRVTWPDAQKLGSATLENGATVVMRNGQPFVVSSPDANGWDVSWRYTGVKGEGWPITWSASGSLDKLEMSCRARSHGWQKAVSWLWPTRELFLQGTAPVALGNRRFVVVPLAGAPIRLSSRVIAAQEVSPEARWDERALPLLESAARNAKTLSPGATWTIVQSPKVRDASAPIASLNGISSTRSAAAPNADATQDTATYAILPVNSFRDTAAALTECAQIIAARAPQTSIKWTAREKPVGKEAAALLWLDFKPIPAPKTRTKRRRRRKTPATIAKPSIGARGGWIVRAGESKGTPIDWWNDSLSSTQAVGATPQPTVSPTSSPTPKTSPRG